MKAANDAVPSCLPPSPEPRNASSPDFAELISALKTLSDALVMQAEAISQLAVSNETLANAVMSQPDEDGEGGSAYLS